MFWSEATGKIYSYLSGYRTVVEIDPVSFGITRTVDIALPAPSTVVFQSMGLTPDGRFLFLVGEDVISDMIANPTNPKVLGSFGVVRLDTPLPTDPLTVSVFSIPQLDNIRPARFQFAPDGRRLYVTQSNKVSDLASGAQAHNLRLDKLLVFDPSTFPAAPSFVAEIDLLPVGSNGIHGMDLWITGPHGAGSAKAVVVTNATPGVNGKVSLIDAASNTITATIPVGKNPKEVTVYYVGLAASDNQATPIW
jgi:YVTN family beta-propeller protein